MRCTYEEKNTKIVKNKICDIQNKFLFLVQKILMLEPLEIQTFHQPVWTKVSEKLILIPHK